MVARTIMIITVLGIFAEIYEVLLYTTFQSDSTTH